LSQGNLKTGGFIDTASVDEAVSHLYKGNIVSFPTETYYGLGVDPFCKESVRKIFTIKNRPLDKALLLLISSEEMLGEIVSCIPDVFTPLMEKFWPGPLTLLFPAGKHIDSLLTGGTGNIGVRISSHRLAFHLCNKWNRAVTATSANVTGQNPASKAYEVRKIFSTSVDYVLDGGQTEGRSGSTIIGYEQDRIKLVRSGPITLNQIKKVLE